MPVWNEWKQKPPFGTPINPAGLLPGGSRGLWAFNEAAGPKVNDLSGRNNTGTLTGGATWVSSSRGPVISFDGSTGYIDCGNSQSLAFVSQSFSLCAWINCAVIPGANRMMIIARDDNTLGRCYALDIEPSNQVALQIFNAAFGNFNLNPVVGRWYHIAGTYSFVTGTNSVVKMYLNGQLQTTTPGVLATQASTGRTTIGQRTYAANNNPFNGQIDAPMIFPYVLSPGQIQALYQNTWQIFQQQPANWFMNPLTGSLNVSARPDVASITGKLTTIAVAAMSDHPDTLAATTSIINPPPLVAYTNPTSVQVDAAASKAKPASIDPRAVK